jgi:hypothetical protein
MILGTTRVQVAKSRSGASSMDQNPFADGDQMLSLILVRLYAQRSFVLSGLPHPALQFFFPGSKRVLNGGRVRVRVIDERMAMEDRDDSTVNPRGGAKKQISA